MFCFILLVCCEDMVFVSVENVTSQLVEHLGYKFWMTLVLLLEFILGSRIFRCICKIAKSDY